MQTYDVSSTMPCSAESFDVAWRGDKGHALAVSNQFEFSVGRCFLGIRMRKASGKSISNVEGTIKPYILLIHLWEK